MPFQSYESRMISLNRWPSPPLTRTFKPVHEVTSKAGLIGWVRIPAKPPPAVTMVPFQVVLFKKDCEAPPITTSSKGPHTKLLGFSADHKISPALISFEPGSGLNTFNGFGSAPKNAASDVKLRWQRINIFGKYLVFWYAYVSFSDFLWHELTIRLDFCDVSQFVALQPKYCSQCSESIPWRSLWVCFSSNNDAPAQEYKSTLTICSKRQKPRNIGPWASTNDIWHKSIAKCKSYQSCKPQTLVLWEFNRVFSRQYNAKWGRYGEHAAKIVKTPSFWRAKWSMADASKPVLM